ncbi:MAG TPA: methionine biosynthesis protein MetW, partial [Gaiellaceae bacterium]
MPEDSLIAQEAELDAIMARLHDAVEGGESELAETGVDRYSARRREAERLWAVSAERPYLERPGRLGHVRGLALRPVKSTLRRLMRWYVEPLANEQRRFNAVALHLLDALAERVGAFDRFSAAQGRRAVELEERLTRLERRERRPAASAPAASPAPAPTPAVASVPDYFAFESRMRGSTESIRERQRPYVDDFRDAAPVLDIGCGRGEFLALLRAEGIDASGVDLDADMVAYARGEGLEVAEGDAVAHLESLEDGSLGGIFAAQLVE